MSKGYLEKILNARVYDVAIQSPLQLAVKLSKRLGNRVMLKREDLQPVFSFKLRGAYNKIYRLQQQRTLSQVIAASAGNHAQGVALAAQRLGVKALIIMPKTTPAIKVDAVRHLGAKAVLYGDTYDEAYEHAQQLAAKDDIPLIHPYDDLDIIAGQGTVAVELLQQHQDTLDAVFIPVGGGGLLAGMAAYIKAIRPGTQVIAVEPQEAACLAAALKAGRRVSLSQVGIFADGVAVKQIGKVPYQIAKDLVDDVVLVDTDEICAAIKDIFEDTRSIAEPAGALALAGMKKYLIKHAIQDKTVATVVTGANMNFDRLRHVSERAELGEHREMLMAVEVPEEPGSFRTFCRALGKRSITEFNYRYADKQVAHIFAGVEVSGDAERQTLLSKLGAKGFNVVDMSNNEMAKLHIRYMVGGHMNDAIDEYLLRLEFPEKPGALMKFLDYLAPAWNISLFHYRNHGAAYGRVLVGLQIPSEDKHALRQSLDDLGYLYWDETKNPAYRFFLQ